MTLRSKSHLHKTAIILMARYITMMMKVLMTIDVIMYSSLQYRNHVSPGNLMKWHRKI